MEKIRKSVFIIKVALFCLVFFLVSFISVHALTEMKHNERLILRNIPKQQMDPASRIMVIKTTDKNYPYLLTTLDFAAYKFNGSGTQIHESFPSNLYVLKDGMIKRDIYDSMGGNLLFSYRCQFSGSKYNVESYTNGGNLVIIGRGLALNTQNLNYYLNDLDFTGDIQDITIKLKPAIHTEGSEHKFIGNIEFHDYWITSDSGYPLVFKMIKDSGYTYLCGRGIVTDKDGKIYKLGYDDTVDKWLPLLKSDDQLDREGAAQALGWLVKTREDKDKAVPALIGALTDNAMEVRCDSAESLGRIGDPRALETLNQIAKDDKDDWVREVAEESLGLIEVKVTSEKLADGDKTAITELSKALDHKWFLVRRTAVESLAKGGADAIEPLVKALKNDDTETRINSAKSLAEIGDKRAIEPLKSAQAEEKDEDVKKAFEEAIGKLKE